MSKVLTSIVSYDDTLTSALGKEAYRLLSRVTKGRRYRRYIVSEIYIKELGDFTEVEVTIEHRKIPNFLVVGTGFSKKSPRDPWNKMIGCTVALSRAIRDALDIPATHVAQ
jgi:hypothetical protein